MKPNRNGSIVFTFDSKNEKPEEARRYDFSSRLSVRLGTKEIGQILSFGKNDYLSNLANNNNSKECSNLRYVQKFRLGIQRWKRCPYENRDENQMLGKQRY